MEAHLVVERRSRACVATGSGLRGAGGGGRAEAAAACPSRSRPSACSSSRLLLGVELGLEALEPAGERLEPAELRERRLVVLLLVLVAFFAITLAPLARAVAAARSALVTLFIPVRIPSA